MSEYRFPHETPHFFQIDFQASGVNVAVVPKIERDHLTALEENVTVKQKGLGTREEEASGIYDQQNEW